MLAGAVLGGVALSSQLEAYVADRAGGNPFFVEELLRALEETEGLIQHDGAMTLAPGAAEWLERAGDRAAAIHAGETAIGRVAIWKEWAERHPGWVDV